MLADDFDLAGLQLSAGEGRRLDLRVGLEPVAAHERGEHTAELAELWDQMTEVRRTAPGASW